MKSMLDRVFGLLLCMLFPSLLQSFDLTIVGGHNFASGIGRRSISLIRTLSDSLTINYLDNRPAGSSERDVDSSVLEIMKNPDKTPGTIAFFVGTILTGVDPHYKLNSKIKCAFITLESSQMHPGQVANLNTYFDAIVVPDIWLVNVLKESGVKVPIFVIPEMCCLEDFLKQPPQEKPHAPFVFGVSAVYRDNKNYDLLLEAFAAEFKNSEKVILKIHNESHRYMNKLQAKIKSLDLKNVVVNPTPQLPWKEYVENHMGAIDCYVLVSLGEGFSVTPREALALGRPCILANHTAHKTICDTGFVRSVTPTIIQKHSGEYYGVPLGVNYNCEVEKVREAMRDVYEHYDSYLGKAYPGREWVKQYLADNLKPLYLSLFKPKRIIMGSKNEVTADYVMTDSEALYKKYRGHFNGQVEA